VISREGVLGGDFRGVYWGCWGVDWGVTSREGVLGGVTLKEGVLGGDFGEAAREGVTWGRDTGGGGSSCDGDGGMGCVGGSGGVGGAGCAGGNGGERALCGTQPTETAHDGGGPANKQAQHHVARSPHKAAALWVGHRKPSPGPAPTLESPRMHSAPAKYQTAGGVQRQHGMN